MDSATHAHDLAGKLLVVHQSSSLGHNCPSKKEEKVTKCSEITAESNTRYVDGGKLGYTEIINDKIE